MLEAPNTPVVVGFPDSGEVTTLPNLHVAVAPGLRRDDVADEK